MSEDREPVRAADEAPRVTGATEGAPTGSADPGMEDGLAPGSALAVSLRRRSLLKAASTFAATLTALGVDLQDWTAVQRGEARPPVSAQARSAARGRVDPARLHEVFVKAEGYQVQGRMQWAVEQVPGLSQAERDVLGKITDSEYVAIRKLMRALDLGSRGSGSQLPGHPTAPRTPSNTSADGQTGYVLW